MIGEEEYQPIEEFMEMPLSARKAHLNLKTPCVRIGDDSRDFRGLLAWWLSVTIPKGNRIHLCHACNVGDCSNPKHLYFGTRYENIQDAVISGAYKKVWTPERKIKQSFIMKERMIARRTKITEANGG